MDDAREEKKICERIKMATNSTRFQTQYQEPDLGDISVIADSIRLRLAKHKIQQRNLKMTRKEYRALYKLVEGPLVRLGCSRNELTQLRPIFKYCIPNTTLDLFGIETQVNHIHTTLNSTGNMKPDAVVITGAPGIGKTELVSQYFKTYGIDYDHAVFINFHSLETSFKDIATILDLGNTTNINVIVKMLEEYFKDEKVLFVYDNVTDTAHLNEVLIKDFYHIITTQIQNWEPIYEQIKVAVLTSNDALQMLGTINNNQQNTNDLELLAEKLENHPLAIEHAISFINQSGITLNKYFGLLEAKTLQMLSEKITLSQNEIKTSIFSSFLLTIQNLQNEDPDAFGLLSIIGLLDGGFIEESFAQTFCTNEWQYTRIKKVLIEYSMIKFNQRVSELDGHVIQYITIHSLYQQAVIYTLNQQNLIQNKVKLCMEIVSFNHWSKYINKNHNCSQFLHLWKQASLQDMIIDYINNDPCFICVFSSYSFKGNILLKENLFSKLRESFRI